MPNEGVNEMGTKIYRFTKKCKCCGLEFQTNSPQKLFCDREHYLPCPVCGKPVLKKDRDFTRPAVCCSVECTVKKNQMNLPMRKCAICGEMFKVHSGIATICEKEHHIPCSICGKDMIVTKEMWHAKIDTCSAECRKEKTRRLCQQKYGVDHPMQNSEVQSHHRASMKSKYGVEFALQKKEFLDAACQTNMDRFGTRFACLRPECREKSPASLISSENARYGQMLLNMQFDVQYEKMIDSRLFDLYLPEIKTVFEIDPTYTHNAYGNHWDGALDKNYHKMKTGIAEKAGLRCIHVFEWDATEKILNLVRKRTQLGARKCEIREVDSSTCNQFLDKYHLQGSVYNQKFRYGLFYKNTLVQVMTFGKARYAKDCDIELIRLCSDPRYNIIGGAERLFKHAITDHPEWEKVLSYCDRAKFRGDVYTKLGMAKIRETPPQAVWSKGKNKITSSYLRQQGFDRIFKTNYGKGTSNEQLMLENGWLPVYDCGQAVYLFERSKV